MSGFFLRFFLIILALWFLRRALGFLLGAGRPEDNQQRQPNAGAKGDTVRDPVCGMYMDPRVAVRVDEGRGSFYFCSNECKEKFLAGRQS
jgi:YHS domain-containing protein